jgi:ATP-dependent DNA helicase RecG
MDSNGKPEVAPVRRVLPVFRTARLNTHVAAAPAAGPTSPFDSTPGEAVRMGPITPPAPPVVAPVAAEPGPKRMSFATMDARIASEDEKAQSDKQAAAAATASVLTGTTVTTAQKTADAVADMRLQQAMKAAKKVKGQLDMAKFGLVTEAQWLLFSPTRYDDYKTLTKDFSQLHQGNVAVVDGTMVSKKLYDARKQETTNPKAAVRLSAILKDVKGATISVNAFGKPGFAWKNYDKGSRVVIRAKPQRAFNGYGLELPNPEIVDKDLLGQIVPIYPPLKVTKGAKFKVEVDRHLDLIDVASQIIEADSGWHDKNAPVSMAEMTGFNSGKELIMSLHRPRDVRDGENAMRAAKLISAYTLVRKTAERSKAIKVDPKSIINIDMDQVQALKKRFPYPLTGDQHTVVDGICKSLKSPKPMDGLLSGDVGTGKTASFMLPMVAAFKAGKRCMLLTPNLLLISQFAREMGNFFPEVPVCTVNGKGIQGDPANSIVIGTTALINAMKKGKVGKMPDFLVVDEQHKFSVEQRESLNDVHTNKLEATATPIPRTAALATHGAHDLFLLRDVPVQKKITTEVLGAADGKKAGQAIIDALRRGEQAAVIYPLVTASEDVEGEAPKNDAKKAVNGAADNWKKYVPIEEIAVLHGKMKDAEKEEVLSDFREGRKKLLLSSIVIEVGVTLPELKTMLVTDADCFGVVTLHQLRGRLARHGGEGHFVLYSEKTEDPEALERLNLVADNTDGFDLAEKDAEVRGFGDILGIDGDGQSGATKALFQGVKIGPREISFAANIHEKAMTLGEAEEHNLLAKKGQNLRLA